MSKEEIFYIFDCIWQWGSSLIVLGYMSFFRNQGGCRKERYFIVGGGGGGVEKEVVVQNCATGASGSARPHSFYCRL